MAQKMAGADRCSELRYRIRANAQHLSEQADMMNQLRDYIKVYLAKPRGDPEKYDALIELSRALEDLTAENKILLKELRDDIRELQFLNK